MAKKKNVTVNQLFTWYMSEGEKGNFPESITTFAAMNNFDENQFYRHFDSFLELEKNIFSTLFDTAVNTLHESEEFVHFSKKDQLLSLYFTFFENLTLNRNFIVALFKKHGYSLQSLAVLSLLKEHYSNFIDQLNLQELTISLGPIENIQKATIRETSWVQMLFTIKFWLDDTSVDCEKTDVLIEKAVSTSVDLIDTKALNNIIDLGKFLFKEKLQPK